MKSRLLIACLRWSRESTPLRPVASPGFFDGPRLLPHHVQDGGGDHQRRSVASGGEPPAAQAAGFLRRERRKPAEAPANAQEIGRQRAKTRSYSPRGSGASSR